MKTEAFVHAKCVCFFYIPEDGWIFGCWADWVKGVRGLLWQDLFVLWNSMGRMEGKGKEGKDGSEGGKGKEDIKDAHCVGHIAIWRLRLSCTTRNAGLANTRECHHRHNMQEALFLGHKADHMFQKKGGRKKQVSEGIPLHLESIFLQWRERRMGRDMIPENNTDGSGSHVQIL